MPSGPAETDNRDMNTTWLFPAAIEVDPWDLVVNAIENAVLDGSVREPLITRLGDIQSEVAKYIE